MRHLAGPVLAVCAVVMAGVAHATPPVVTSVYPERQRINAGKNTIIEVHFDQAIDPASVTSTSFRVFGRWSGPASGAFIVNGATITFTPSRAFYPGEWMTVSLSKGITNVSAEHMAKGYAWNFWIATAKGTLTLTYTGRLLTHSGPETWVEPYGSYAGDLNHDGWCDMTVPCEQTSDARVFMSSSGTYSSFVKQSLVNGNTPSPNDCGDFDNDGEIDLAIGNTQSDKTSIIFGDGTGNFPAGRKTSVTCGTTVRGVGVADLNGDGWDDIVTANRNGGGTGVGNLSIVLNNGDGTFAPAVTKDTGQSDEYTIAIADANNDGIPDIFCGTFGSAPKMVVLLGDGNGGFTVHTTVAEGGKPWHSVVGDFNNDGNVDVASCNSDTNTMGILFGNGLGGFTGAVTLVACDTFPLAITAGDIDGDGDLELVTSCYHNASNGTWNVFQNTAGVFGNKKVLNASSAGSCATLYDRDNDGDLDMTGIDEVDDYLYFFRNDGTATGVQTPTAGSSVTLLQNEPNPFNPTTSIRFELRESESVQLAIYDLHGAIIAKLASGRYASGPHEVRWDGTDTRGDRVSSGVYFYRLAAGTETLTRKMVLLK